MESTEEPKNACFEKLTWKTKELATAAAAYAKWQYGSHQKITPYRCKNCNQWHLARSSLDTQ